MKHGSLILLWLYTIQNFDYAGRKLTRGSSYKKDVSEAFVGDKDGSNKKFTGSVTFAAPRALVRPLGWTKTEAAPDADSEHPKSNDEFRNMLLNKWNNVSWVQRVSFCS